MGKEEDPVISIIGDFGKWQFLLLFTVSMVGIPAAWHFLAMNFVAPSVDFWCTRPPGFEQWSVEEWRNLSSPIITQAGKEIHDPCNIFNLNYSNIAAEEEKIFQHDINSTITCSKWEYDHTLFGHTIVNKWDLVCDHDQLPNLAQSIFMFGVLIGAVVSGMVSDQFGRKKMLLFSAFLMIIASIATAFSPTFTAFVILRWFVAFAAVGLFTTGFVLVMEVVGGKWRTICGIGIEFPWTVGYCMLAGFAYLLPDWNNLLLLISVPVILLLSFWWLIPESPRWLLATGKTKAAEKVLKTAAKRNGKSYPDGAKLILPEKKSSGTWISLFRTPNLRKKTVNIYFNWFVNSFVYYGLSLGTENLGGNVYVNFLLSGAVEIPAYLISIFVLLKLGRRWPLSATMVVGGVACLCTGAIPRDVYAYNWPIVTLATVGKFGISASFAIIYVFSAELYPTVVRNVGMGSSSMCARVGSMIAPFVGSLKKTDPYLPIAIFGLSSVIAGLLALLLPETNNCVIPDSVEEGEAFGTDRDIFACLKRKSTSYDISKRNQDTETSGVQNPTFQQ